MADPVGLAASIVGLGELALHVASALYKFSVDVKSAPEQAERLCKELGDLQTVCRVVEETFRVEAEGLPQALDSQIAGVKQVLEGMLKRVAQEKTSGLRRFKWPFTKLENAEHIAEIERIKSTLTLIVNVDQT